MFRDIWASFREMGRKGSRTGGKRSLKPLTAEQRTEREGGKEVISSEWLDNVSRCLYVCCACGVTMFGQSIPGEVVVVARVGARGLEFTCPKCPAGMLEPIVSEVPPQSWRSDGKDRPAK